jgi:SAM-dependent methyltransferase
MKLNKDDFKCCFEANLSSYVQNKIKEYAFVHKELNYEEQRTWVWHIFHVLSQDLKQAGESRQEEWNKGWADNLTSNTPLPKYFGKYNILRWKQSFVQPISENYEVNMLHLIVDWLADKYMRDTDSVYEFGCGTGHNLQHIRMVNKNAILVGLDWADSSQEIIRNQSHEKDDGKLLARHFDFFNPDYDIDIWDNAVICTIASLEQIGKRYDKFLDYLLYYNPKLCIHVEPIEELLDNDNFADRLSIEYFKKRNYLSGFLTRLRQLESEGRIEIIRVQRTYIGSLFIEGYSVVVWKPKQKA